MVAPYYASDNMNISSVERGDPLWAVVLDSPRESQRYHDALAALLSSDYEQKLLYALGDRSAVERMLNTLELESQVNSSKLKTKKDRRKAFVLLKRMCRTHAKLPSTYVIEEGIKAEGSHPYAFGGAADVWKGRHDGKLVAIKSLRICWSQGEMGDGIGIGGKKVDMEMRRLKQKFCHEAVVWKRLSHPNLLPFLGVNETLFPLAMISEWMEHGTILQFVKRNVAANRLKLLHDVASGLDYLHDQPFVHSDIKSGNILIDSNLNACIGDFGLTNITSSASISMALSTPPTGGTCRWMAPELLMGDDADGVPQKSSKESDVYSFGMMAYEIFAHCAPFRHRILDHQVIVDVTAGRRPERPPRREVLGLDDSVWNMVQECWDSDPRTRPTIKEVRSFLESVFRNWTPPASEEVDGLDFDPSAEANVDSSTSLFTASDGFHEPLETPARSRADFSNATLHGSDDGYVDFTSYSDGTDSYHHYSSTERSIGNPSGTLQSSDVEESSGIAFSRETTTTTTLRTREWVRAHVSRRRPGVTFEETPTVHFVLPSPSETSTDLSDEIPPIQIVPPSPLPGIGMDVSEDKTPVMRIVPPSPLDTFGVLPGDPFQIFTRSNGFLPSSPDPIVDVMVPRPATPMLPTTPIRRSEGANRPSTIPLPPAPSAQEQDTTLKPGEKRKRRDHLYPTYSPPSSPGGPPLRLRVRRKKGDDCLRRNLLETITYAPRVKPIPLPLVTDGIGERAHGFIPPIIAN